MTFSVVFHDRESKTWGVGVASKFLSVGSVVPWAKAGIGAVATQAYVNYSFGPDGLKLLRDKDAETTLNALIAADKEPEVRQVAIVDRKGDVAAHTGEKCLDYAGHITGDGFSVQGNILAGSKVVEGMAKEMERGGPIIERVIRTLDAAESNGGDRRGKQSAAILIATSGKPFEPFSDRLIDLRVDDSVEPLKEIRRLRDLWEATFFEQEMVKISDHRDKILTALKKSGYSSLSEWAGNNNFDDRVTQDEVGDKVLKVLLSETRRKW